MPNLPSQHSGSSYQLLQCTAGVDRTVDREFWVFFQESARPVCNESAERDIRREFRRNDRAGSEVKAEHVELTRSQARFDFVEVLQDVQILRFTHIGMKRSAAREERREKRNKGIKREKRKGEPRLRRVIQTKSEEGRETKSFRERREEKGENKVNSKQRGREDEGKKRIAEERTREMKDRKKQERHNERVRRERN